MSRDEVEKSALECIRGLSCSPQWIPKTESSRNRICVNYLRHRQSAYHLLLKQDLPYLKAFTLVNQAIASSYPWLIAEATLQIKKKSKKYE